MNGRVLRRRFGVLVEVGVGIGIVGLFFVVAGAAAADEASSSGSESAWRRVAPPLTGRRTDVPLGAVGPDGPLLILGGRTAWADYKQPRPYDVLQWNAAASCWENQFPPGRDWGPPVGLCSAPAWKDERFGFIDVAGEVRPNWTVYGAFSLGQKFDYDPDSKRFYFYAFGRTFSYDPAAKRWADLQPPNDPERELGGTLLWSSMVYDAHRRRMVLFGGGNIPTERGDPGTWSYSPSENRWRRIDADPQPPPRANSRLVYDPVARKIVLFGGDQLHQLLSDTWEFDVETDRWAELRGEANPAPRAGHALVWLPTARRIALVGGYGYSSTVGYVESLYRRLPWEAWALDREQGRWRLIRAWDEQPLPAPRNDFFLSAAVQRTPRGDRLSLLADGLWQTELDGSRYDDEAGRRRSVRYGAVERRTGSYDPAWYREEVPPADRERVAQELAETPVNTWRVRPTPKRPGMNVDWGSAVFVEHADQIVRFSGGHSAYSGTAPQVYDVATDRYSLPFAPEMPLEFVYSNDQVSGEWSFGGNPWMTGHTYKSTGYDPRLRQFLFAPRERLYFFDSATGRWSRGPDQNPYRADFYNVTVCATPEGAVVWGAKRQGGAGLWRLDAASRTWRPLDLRGAELPAQSPDQHGLAFDAKRRRLLFFSGIGPTRGDVVEYDLATNVAKRLEAKDASSAVAPSREAVYLPESDVVLTGARVVRDGRPLWLVYDCKSNAWLGLPLEGADPIAAKPGDLRPFNNSVGLVYDPRRRLVWAVGQYGHVHVLKVDVAAAVAL